MELNAGYEYNASVAGNAHTVVDMGKELEFTVQMRQNQWTHGFRNPPIVLEAGEERRPFLDRARHAVIALREV